MTADFSRVRSNPLLDYAGVELKQGGVLLDADANELVAILDRRLRALASDVLGRATVSATTPDAFKLNVVAGALLISKGRLYVDGLLAENHGAVSTDAAQRVFDPLLAEPAFANAIDYAAQPYLPNAPALPTSGRRLVYLDVCHRPLTYLERPDLVETVVGVETSSRLQTVWQVRVHDAEVGGSVSCASPDADIPGWSDFIAPSSGRLTTGTFEVAATTDPCELPPTGGYRGQENQLYRVEIHDPGQPGGAATFKWSRDNASVGSRVSSMISATELELETLGRDDVLRFNTGDWVEITDDVRELSQLPGEMRRITINEANRRITFAPALPAVMLPGSFPNNAHPAARNLRVRRWDQKGRVFRTGASGNTVEVQDLDAAGSTGLIRVPAAGTTLILENGVTVSFSSVGVKGFRAGDWWVFAARTSDASVELLDAAAPRGVHHHYARLGFWDVAAGTVADCRHPWPPEGGADCACTQCVTQESHSSGQLTIQAAVDRVRETGGTICIGAGQYTLAAPVNITGARSLRIRGQGPATVITAPGSAFALSNCTGMVIEELSVVSLGQQSAISVRTAAGLSLQKLVIAVFGVNDAPGAAIALSGTIFGALIKHNLIVASQGVRAIEPAAGGGTTTNQPPPQFLVTAAIAIEDNILLCQREAVALRGTVAHAYGTRIHGNEILNCRESAISVLGFALPGAAMRISDNTMNVNGPGIRCSVDGAWIEGNKLNAVRQGQRQPTGSGIELITGLDPNGSDQCQVLANQISGFPDAGVLIQAPTQELLVKLNIIEGCGNGILMLQEARGGAVSIENNHVHNIGSERAEPKLGRFSIGIGLSRTNSANVVGNSIRQVGVNASAGQQVIAGILGFGVVRSRIHGNDINEIGPVGDFSGAIGGILMRAPYDQLEVAQNHIERDAQPLFTASNTMWQALSMEEPRLEAGRTVVRTASYTAMRVDDTRTLVVANDRAYVNVATLALDELTGAQVVQGASATVLGNTLIARGRGPAVDVVAAGDVMFSNNRCESRANAGRDAVQIAGGTAIASANRVRGGEISMRLQVPAQRVTVVGNITTNGIVVSGVAGGLPAVWEPLNIRA